MAIHFSEVRFQLNLINTIELVINIYIYINTGHTKGQNGS